MLKQKNVKNTIISALPDNRPITSLQIVEDYDKCVSLLEWSFNDIVKFLIIILIKLNILKLGVQKILCQFIEHMIKIPMLIYGAKQTSLDVVPHAICVYPKVKAYRNILLIH